MNLGRVLRGLLPFGVAPAAGYGYHEANRALGRDAPLAESIGIGLGAGMAARPGALRSLRGGEAGEAGRDLSRALRERKATPLRRSWVQDGAPGGETFRPRNVQGGLVLRRVNASGQSGLSTNDIAYAQKALGRQASKATTREALKLLLTPAVGWTAATGVDEGRKLYRSGRKAVEGLAADTKGAMGRLREGGDALKSGGEELASGARDAGDKLLNAAGWAAGIGLPVAALLWFLSRKKKKPDEQEE